MANQITAVLSFQDPAGNPLAGGSVTFDLSFDLSAAVSGGPQVSAGRTVTATLDNTGTCIVNLWPNSLQPSGSVYFVKAYAADGQPAWEGQLTFTSSSPD
jgi:hypothetical protein